MSMFEKKSRRTHLRLDRIPRLPARVPPQWRPRRAPSATSSPPPPCPAFVGSPSPSARVQSGAGAVGSEHYNGPHVPGKTRVGGGTTSERSRTDTRAQTEKKILSGKNLGKRTENAQQSRRRF